MYQKKEINEAKFKVVQHNLGGTALVSLPVNSLMQQQQNFLSSVKIPILKNGKKIHILLNAWFFTLSFASGLFDETTTMEFLVLSHTSSS